MVDIVLMFICYKLGCLSALMPIPKIGCLITGSCFSLIEEFVVLSSFDFLFEMLASSSPIICRSSTTWNPLFDISLFFD